MQRTHQSILIILSLAIVPILLGYVFFSDKGGLPGGATPKGLPGKATTAGTIPEQQLKDWKSYHDAIESFDLRYPPNWTAQVAGGSPYTVHFLAPTYLQGASRNNAYAFTVRVYHKSSFESLVASAQKESRAGLFPPIAEGTVDIFGVSAPSFAGFTNSDSSMTFSKAIARLPDAVFEFVSSRPTDRPEIEGIFDIWLRSFSR